MGKKKVEQKKNETRIEKKVRQEGKNKNINKNKLVYKEKSMGRGDNIIERRIKYNNIEK